MLHHDEPETCAVVLSFATVLLPQVYDSNGSNIVAIQLHAWYHRLSYHMTVTCGVFTTYVNTLVGSKEKDGANP
jgi:hypothetical protein